MTSPLNVRQHGEASGNVEDGIAGRDQLLCVVGGARNAFWNQSKADAVQCPLTLPDEPEAGLKSAALLGAAGAGLIADPAQEAIARRTSGTLVQPSPDSAVC